MFFNLAKNIFYHRQYLKNLEYKITEITPYIS